ncbi:hypothetical protein [Morganella psychrotolerans]|uniref:Uncharacterized protein n=1 Tax=Morganella psychrotolerans TaxID=368603 RepID=A0A1B8HFE0_9GAMM|nr:hypothetical protein [Morganella psychrotolerans]OBU07790.1 hypothetical protein AYY18_06115 [Morganella psychrotolerans]
MSKYSNLWQVLGETLCKHHRLDHSRFIEGYEAESTIRKKAHFLFLLEIALFEYRKNEVGIWFKQSPEATLHSFVYSKTGMLPDKFDKLTNNAKLIVLHKPLTELELPEAAQTYLSILEEPAVSDNFEIDPFEGWTLGTGWLFLRRE